MCVWQVGSEMENYKFLLMDMAYLLLCKMYTLTAYLTYMQSTSWETLGWKKHKLESRLPGEISITLDMQMTPPLWQKVKVKSLSRVRHSATPWTVAHQAPPSMGFSRQEYWSGLPLPSPGDLPDPGIEPRSPAFQADALNSEPPGTKWRGTKKPLDESERAEWKSWLKAQHS